MTNRAKTLRDHASMSAEEFDADASALVLIDYQNEYVSGALPLENAEHALNEAERVLNAYRRAGSPIFHVAHHGRPKGPLFDPERELASIHPKVAPKDGEPIIYKALPNAFEGTELAELVKATGRDKLTIIGFMTHMCVSSTVRHAAENGLKIKVVADACATRNLPNPLDDTSNVEASDVHLAALAALSDRFATIVTRV